jgi:uncharacterized membrane protein
VSTGLNLLVGATALAAGTSGGALYAFSSFVMPALRKLPGREAVLAMQSMNVEAPKFPFMLPFLGAAVGSLAVAGHAVVARDDDWLLRLGAAGLYLAAIGITGAYHVPRNNALMAVDADSAGAAAAWSRFATEWVRMNHVRTAAALGSATLYVVALTR